MLTVIAFERVPNGINGLTRIDARCICECGKDCLAQKSLLRRGKKTHCGCIESIKRSEAARKRGATYEKHRMIGTPTYWSWAGMKARCLTPSNSRYKDYGGRGIKVCERWLELKNFIEDMGLRPEGKSIERKDVNGDYEPANCCWADAKEQAANKRLIK